MCVEPLRIGVLIFAIAFAGCAGPSDSPQGILENPNFGIWNLSDCIGFDTSHTFPADSGPGDSPEGWEFDPATEGRFATYVALTVLQCTRVSINGFERGPVSLIFETHSKFSPAANCEEPPLDYMSILNSLLTNDETLANLLVSMQIPAHFAEISVDVGRDLAEQTWAWKYGNGTSQLAVSGVPPFQAIEPEVERMIWQVGVGLGRLDVSWTHSTPQAAIPLAVGELGAGMLYSGQDSKAYYGLADISGLTTSTATLQFYGDLACEKLRPSA